MLNAHASRRECRTAIERLFQHFAPALRCPEFLFAFFSASQLDVRDFAKEENSTKVRKAFPQLSQAQVTAALMYYARYRDEVQAKIDANAALTPESIERRYPRLVQFAR